VAWTQFNVLLVAPRSEEDPNYLKDPLYGLQPMVGVVANDIQGGRPPLLVGSTDATIVGQGITEGIRISVPNQGTQWRPVFASHYLDVQVAAATPEEVGQKSDEAVEAIADALRARQSAAGISGPSQIRALASSPDPTIYWISGSRPRAAIGTAVAGAGATIWLVYFLELRSRRRADSEAGSEAGRVATGAADEEAQA
jgi:hypothetical protein